MSQFTVTHRQPLSCHEGYLRIIWLLFVSPPPHTQCTLPSTHSHSSLLHPCTHPPLIITAMSTVVLWTKPEDFSFTVFSPSVAAKLASSLCTLREIGEPHWWLVLSSKTYHLELLGEFLFWKATGIAHEAFGIWSLKRNLQKPGTTAFGCGEQGVLERVGCSFFLFLKTLYLFIFREKGREGEREGQKHRCARDTMISSL